MWEVLKWEVCRAFGWLMVHWFGVPGDSGYQPSSESWYDIEGMKGAWWEERQLAASWSHVAGWALLACVLALVLGLCLGWFLHRRLCRAGR